MPHIESQAIPKTSRDGLRFLLRMPFVWQLFCAVWLLLAVYWQWLIHADGILGEMWDTLPAYQRLGEMGFVDILQELYRKYAMVHILALPKLGFWLDFYLAGASGNFTRTSSFIASCLIAWLLFDVARRNYQPRHVCFILAVVLFFNGCQALVINWESLLQYYLSVLFAVSAFVYYEKNNARLSVAMLLLLLSGLSCGAGIAALAGFGFMLVARRAPVKILCVYGVYTLLMAVLLRPEKPEGLVLPETFPFFWNAPNLFLQYLAYPLSAWVDARWLGACVLLSGSHSVYRCLISRKAGLHDYLFLYFLLLGVTIVLGRYAVIDSNGDISRYYIYIAPIWYFALLKLLPFSRMLFALTASAVGLGVAVTGLAAVVMIADVGQKMALGKVVALNGNFEHFSKQRLDAMQRHGDTLSNGSAYLRAHNMDIYRNLQTEVPDTAEMCHAQLIRKTGVTKGAFVDYFIKEKEGNFLEASEVLATDTNRHVLYYGTAISEVAHLKVRLLALRDVRVTDWPLLLPVAWQPARYRVLYLHLPRAVPLSSVSLWAMSGSGQACKISVEPLSVAPE